MINKDARQNAALLTKLQRMDPAITLVHGTWDGDNERHVEVLLYGAQYTLVYCADANGNLDMDGEPDFDYSGWRGKAGQHTDKDIV